jgi:hypothetical protein
VNVRLHRLSVICQSDSQDVARPAHLRASRYGALGPEPSRGLPTVAHGPVGKVREGWRARPTFAQTLRRASMSHRAIARGRADASGGGWRARQVSNLRPSA